MKSLTFNKTPVSPRIVGLSILLLWVLLISTFTLSIQADYNSGPDGQDDQATRAAPYEDGMLLKGTVVTMNDNFDVIEDGAVHIVGEKIEGIYGPFDPLPAGSYQTVETDGLIFPGLLDQHSHVHYNCIPLWYVPKPYGNRYQWSGDANYSQMVTYPNRALFDSYKIGVEAMKYAEVRAMVGGTVAIQGSKTCSDGYKDHLVHNTECTNFGEDNIYQKVTGEIKDLDADRYIELYEKGDLDTLFVHLAEGIDNKAHDEFQDLKDIGLLRNFTVGIHSAGLNASNFQDMADAGAKVVWSPLSNMLLYGGTADIEAAWKAGVIVSLGCDWGPSGSKNLLGELKFAQQINIHNFNNYLTDRNLAEMVTINGAKVANWGAITGSLEAGKYADIMVIDDQGDGYSPYSTLVDSTVANVRMVIIEGNPYYGEVDIMEQLKPGDYEIITSTATGVKKALDITDPDKHKGEQTFAEIEDLLREAMLFDFDFMKANFEHPNYDYKAMTDQEFQAVIDGNFSKGLVPIAIDPYFAIDDPVFFASLRNALVPNEIWNMREKLDMEKIYYSWRYNSSIGPFDDYDNDGLANYRDLDDDGDGIFDSDEIMDGTYSIPINPNQDTDSDNIPDISDTDDDNDGLPDIWEGKYGLDPYDDSDSSADMDGDGSSNYAEYMAGTDPTDITDSPTSGDPNDCDGDGIPNTFDLDDDNDGIIDSWETQYGFDTCNPLDALYDTDGDSFTALEEYLNNTDPTDKTSKPDDSKPNNNGNDTPSNKTSESFTSSMAFRFILISAIIIVVVIIAVVFKMSRGKKGPGQYQPGQPPQPYMPPQEQPGNNPPPGQQYAPAHHQQQMQPHGQQHMQQTQTRTAYPGQQQP